VPGTEAIIPSNGQTALGRKRFHGRESGFWTENDRTVVTGNLSVGLRARRLCVQWRAQDG